MLTTTATNAPGFAIPSSENRGKDVEANLVYSEVLEGQKLEIDFRQPDGEQRFAQLSKFDQTHPTIIHDIRGEESNYTLDKNGFQYVHHEIEGFDEWSNEERVKEVLVPKTEELVRQITGATKTLVFTTRIRCFASDAAKRADNRAPAHSVHSDFTVAGAMENLRATIKDPAELEQILQGRVMVINVWRPLRTVTKDPLAVCDWTSVKPSEEWNAHRFIFPHGWNELGKISHSKDHKWLYLRRQAPTEPLIFTQFDSLTADQGGFTVAHSAFVDPEFLDAPPRESIEIKMYAFFA
ncbi:hypothetical protein P175DRAFT_0483398 [Aspergillus ochraceoroseus IBT 24754]|uniref:Methyltransferase n=3 Tax=Aspergillus subgen. Nidulantes TaxID=2720870 RepID=A0A0F8UAB7_9EURO|nr:uncharacterized protein P175DRAFT_0483398 [Aspergillus ochraceoroseus IBT 24754]KKK12514.1 hypothetical protein AOCH_000049 [Aspergillus ochraceoroseus]KKK16528.1 hypothetical protein ARAM_003066 [Aspergillus rambellii]PTU19695.1 hypothetical protein P175DRAFT_0483398 [Aspergillus ochraceoroseus IBT 24754]